MSHVITYPSGLTGRVRGMKVREERILANHKLAKSGGQVDEQLGARWEETLDPRPYDFDKKDIDWSVVLQGDCFYTLLQVCALTYGPEYAFASATRTTAAAPASSGSSASANCPCAASATRTARRSPPDAGVCVWFWLLTGADARRLPQLRRTASDRLLSAMLGWRVIEVEGVPEKDKHRFIEDLTRARRRLPRRRARPGIEVEWPECFTVQEVELPFDRGFFLRGKARMARCRDQSSSSLA